MKKTTLQFLVLFLLGTSAKTAFSQTVAFPGAVGFGKNATGGRTGTVYHVTNLNDAGAGSFRDAVSVANRIIVFDVSGYITLKTAVSCKGNLTIAGQTAPGEGIGFRGGEISFAKQSNVICRGIRIRPGSETASSEDDALSLYLAHNVILDHCSFEFAPWNNIDGVSDNYQTYPVTDITFQNCIIADPTGQQFGAHTESVNSNWTWAYNIFANSHNRNPLAKVNNVFVNNVLYNCDAGYTTHTSTNFKHDIVNNYFVSGPASGGNFPWYQVDKNQSIYYTGNLKDSNKDGVLNGSGTTPYWYQGTGTVLTAAWSTETKAIPTYSAATAYRYASSFAGTFPYDELDRLILSQVRTLGSGTTGTGTGTTGPGGGLYTSQTQTGLSNNGYGTIATGTKPTDTDGDGMPDFWEKTFGLNESSNDAMTTGSDGYANIEKYINWLADVHAHAIENKTLDIDLSTYTQGFAKVSPTYLVGSAVNGTVTLASDGKTAHFVPKTNFYGMATFKFTVTGSDGTAYTFTVNMVVEKDATITPLDCNGVANGTATLDDCGICVGGNTGKKACVLDCFGVVNGKASLDACGVCVGGTTGMTACTDAIQGEDFCTANGILEAKNLGFQGDGYLNLDNATGSSATWYLVSSTAQTAKLGIRYANAGTAPRPFSISVNGGTAINLKGDTTGAWTNWEVESVTVTLKSGPNLITITATSADGGPNLDEITFSNASLSVGSCTADCNGTIGGNAFLDQCNTCVGGTTGKTACVKDCNGDKDGLAHLDTCGVCVGGNSPYKTCESSMEAELACTVDGVKLESSNTGYSGQGYVNTTNALGASVSWIVNSDVDQTSTLTFRYANGDTINRDGQLFINGTSLGTLLLPSTSDWIVWQTVSVNVPLKKGSNVVKLSATSANGLSNLDLIYLSAGLSNANCIVLGMEDVSYTHEGLRVYPNPTQNKVYWSLEQNWALMNSLGIELQKGQGLEADLSPYTNGLYLLKLDNKVYHIIKK
jgi:hypothetical protein